MTNKLLNDVRKYLASLDDAALKRCVMAYHEWFADERILATKRSAIIVHIMSTDPIMAAGGLLDFVHSFRKKEEKRLKPRRVKCPWCHMMMDAGDEDPVLERFCDKCAKRSFATLKRVNPAFAVRYERALKRLHSK